MPVDKAEFRHAMGHFASAVTVVTAKFEKTKAGITVTAFSSLSLEPPLVLICIDKRARIHDKLQVGGNFAVNILAEDQDVRSREVASSKGDPFEEVGHHEGATGAPLLQGALCAVECNIVDALPGGDHTIFVGQVEAAHVSEGKPLLYFRGGYGQIG